MLMVPQPVFFPFGGTGTTRVPGVTPPTGPTSSTTSPPNLSSKLGISSEFQADKPVRMPVYNSPAQLEAARIKQAAITGRSGRTSTNLVPGTGTYAASFLGGSGSAK